MKKCSKWILGILLVVSVFIFAGCKDDKKDSDGKIVLTVWESANGPDGGPDRRRGKRVYSLCPEYHG